MTGGTDHIMCVSGTGATPPPPTLSGVAGAGGGVGGASNTSAPAGGPPSPLNPASTIGGAGGGAIKGVGQLGGPNDALISTLQALAQTIAKLTEVIAQRMGAPTTGGGGGGCGDEGGAPPPPTGVRGMAGAEVAAPAAMQNPVVGAANVTTGANGREDHAFEQEVLDRVNAIRRQNGLRPLSFNAQLDTAAERHNLVQIQTQSMAHVGIGDGDPGSRIRAAGFRGQWGENVAVGQRSAEQVVREWMNSPTHRANILNPNFGQIGVSYGTTAEGFSFWTQSFGA